MNAAPQLLVRHGRWLALGLVAAALAVRIPGTGTWWLNPDEGIYFSLVTQPTLALFWAEVVANAHPPLYYVILRIMGLFTTDFFWYRGLSIVAGAAAVFAVWHCGQGMEANRLRATVAGLAAATMLVASPAAIALSQIMRPYMLQLALVAGALALLLAYGRAPERRTLGAYVTLVVLALLTHYSSVLALGALGGVTLYLVWGTGMERQAGRRLLLAHAVPAVVVVALYLLHLRGLASSPTAGEALRGWLSFYLVSSPKEAWLAFVGLQTTVGGRGMGGPFTALMLITLVTAWARRAWLPLVVAGSALAVGMAAAIAGVYPMGSTRHSTWMLAFTLPAMAWTLGIVLTSGRQMATVGVVAGVLLVAGRQQVDSALLVAESPWAPTEHVLRYANLTGMLELLDPDGAPRLVVMDLQTYYLLLPFYYVERREARDEPELGISHFTYGQRELVVIQEWLLTGSELRRLAIRLRGAGDAAGLGSGSRGQVLVGGWRTEVVDELLAMKESGEVVDHRVVPGLFAFLVDMRRLGSAGPAGAPQ